MTYAQTTVFQIARGLDAPRRDRITVNDLLEVAAEVTQATRMIDIRDALIERSAGGYPGDRQAG